MRQGKRYGYALTAFGWLVLALALPAVGEPYFVMESESDWIDGMFAGHVEALLPLEWSDYMTQWDDYQLEGDEPYPDNLFLPAMPPDGGLYVYGGGGGGGTDPEDAGLVMYWGNESTPPGSYSSAWKYDYLVDPDLTNCTITVTVTAPQGINVISFGIQDINGNVRAWYWNVGQPGDPIQWNVPTAVTINTSLSGPAGGVAATNPTASAYMNNPLFDITLAQNFIFDENNVWQGPGVAVPTPGLGIIASWNYWHNISVIPYAGIVKWAQPPTYSDLSPFPDCFWGWDEISIYGGAGGFPIVADDFLCEDDRPITDIHWWGSYQHWIGEEAPADAPDGFHIGIWTDVPTNGTPFSHPGTMIHEWRVSRADLYERWVGCDFHPDFMMAPDSCFRYDFHIPMDEWFWQEPGPTVYWVSISAVYLQGSDPVYPWGWKTREHYYNDDAVRVFDPTAPLLGDSYVNGMPIEDLGGTTWDMAFVLTTDRDVPPPSELKWDQPPEPVDPANVYYGWNEYSEWIDPTWPGYDNGVTVADDWLCSTSDPVTKIRWWGSFIDWREVTPPPTLPIHFHVHFWTDTPAVGTNGFSHPDQAIHEIISTNHYTWEFVGWDYDPRTKQYESCFKFEVDLYPEDYFYQDPVTNSIYWISISACYGGVSPRPEYPWGWKTRPNMFNDDAVRIFDPSAPAMWVLPPRDTYIDGEPIYWPTPGDSWDMAFELIAESQGSGTTFYKWEQLPDLDTTGIDVNATAQQAPSYILADDFECTETGPITEIYVWGSWLDDWYPYGIASNVTFELSIHADIPASGTNGYSTPGQLLWRKTFRPGEFTTEEYASNIEEGWLDPLAWSYIFPADWTCWLYIFQIDAADAFFQQGSPLEPIVYWLDVQAYPDEPNTLFGWKTSTFHWNDDAVWGLGNEPYLGPWYELRYPPGHEMVGQSIDLAFAIGGQTGFKWWQDPDLSTMGIDVNDTGQKSSYILADDFLCTTNGPITDVHVYGSWLDDHIPWWEDPTDVTFRLSIHEDIPAGTNGYSMPGALLWERTFIPGEFNATVEAGPIEEGWLDPPDDYTFPADWTCWRYDFDIDPGEAFRQTGTPDEPVVYWLDVQAIPGDPEAVFGWKTSRYHWNDDAVWGTGEDPYTGPWYELRYPPGHIWYGDSIDLAFAITGQATGNEYTKWSQPPEPYVPDDGFNGWNEESIYGGLQIVADDWVCTSGLPVSDVHWWGSFVGWGYPYPPQLPDEFHLGIWTDVPATSTGFSHPGELIWENYCDTFTWRFVGWDWDPRTVGPPEACFLFEQYLDEEDWFWQEEGYNIYWLSISAINSNGTVAQYPWGWKTRPRDLTSPAPDDAVTIFDPTSPSIPAGLNFYNLGAPIWWPTPEQSWDMAFQLTTPQLPWCYFADINCDGTVDNGDFLVMKAPANWLGNPPSCDRTELNGTPPVDNGDYLVLTAPANWGNVLWPCQCPPNTCGY